MSKPPFESLEITPQVREAQEGSFLALSDGVVHYELSGPEGGPWVVLVHGLTTPYFIWDRTAEELVGAGFRVLRYDLFGRGFSDRPDVRYDLGLYERQLLGLLDGLELPGPVSVVGLSMGGAIATHVAAHHSERFDRVALLAPAGVPTHASRLAGLARLPGVGEWLMKRLGNPIVLRGFRRAFSHIEPPQELMDSFREQMRYKGFRRAILSSIRHVPLQDMESTYRKLGQTGLPVLLLWGEEDAVVPCSGRHEIQRWVPQVQHQVFAQAGHLLHVERPEAVHPPLLEFLEG